MQAQNGSLRYRVGDIEIIVVSDGFMRLDGGAVFGLVPRVMWEPAVGPENINGEHRIQLGLNCVIARTSDEVVLIETGMGNKLTGAMRDKVFPGDYGYLLDGLASAGVAPTDVTIVLNTHLHADHCGWNTIERDGSIVPTFANAHYVIARGEYEAAMAPNDRTKSTYIADNFAPLEGTGQLELVSGEQQVAPGIHFLPTPGHTADHSSIVMSSKGDTAYYLGDMVQHATHVERDAWISAFDVLHLVSLATKKRLLEKAIQERALLLTTHAPFPGAGRLEQADRRRRLVPATPEQS